MKTKTDPLSKVFTMAIAQRSTWSKKSNTDPNIVRNSWIPGEKTYLLRDEIRNTHIHGHSVKQ